MTKLKDLKQRRAREAGLVKNPCGCMVVKEGRFWISQIPLMALQRNNRPATMLLSLYQCDKCKAIVDGRTEVLQEEEKLIKVAR